MAARFWMAVLLAAVLAAPATAGDEPAEKEKEGLKATFIKGTYAMQGRCEAWAAIEAGGDKNVETVPETLTEDGFSAWEGGCGFASIAEKVKGRRWVAEMACGDEAEEYKETDTFDLDPTTGHITVTVDGNKSVFVRCDAAKGN